MTTPTTSSPTTTATAHDGARIEVRDLTKRFGEPYRRRRPSFTVDPGPDHRVPRPERRRQDDDAAHAARPGPPDQRHRDHRRQELRRHPARPTGRRVGPRGHELPPWPDGRDHLRVLADTAGVSAARVDEMLELVGIPAAARSGAGGYSMGMRQRLGLAAAMLGDPQVLLLDEPANGLDPEGIRWLRGFLRHLSHEGKTILISSHMLQEVEQTVDDVVIISERPARSSRARSGAARGGDRAGPLG